jgi:hypothetical protein
VTGFCEAKIWSWKATVPDILSGARHMDYQSVLSVAGPELGTVGDRGKRNRSSAAEQERAKERPR